jgi:predicted RNA-binding Zn-ribbon protein involved in translation (DUF1610 family)
MGKQYAFSCHKCFAFYSPVPLHEALSKSECPSCGATIGSKKDFVLWICDNCGEHNDYDWEKCYKCGK